MVLNSNFSSFGSRIPVAFGEQFAKADVSASGSEIMDTVPDFSASGYRSMSGTSMATPVGASALSLMLGKSPEQQAVEDKQTARDVRDLAKDLNLSINAAVETYLFGDADNFELGMSEVEIKKDRDQRRQEMMNLLALNQPENQRAVARGPIALLD